MNFGGEKKEMYNNNWGILNQIPPPALPLQRANVGENINYAPNTNFPPPTGLNGLFNTVNYFDQAINANPYNLDFSTTQNALMPQDQFAQNYQNPMAGLFQSFMGLMQSFMQLMGQFMGLQINNQNNFMNNAGNTGNIAIAGVDGNGNVFAGAMTGNTAPANPANPNYPTNTNYTGPVPQGNTGNQAAQIALHESTLGINEADGSYKKYGQPSHWCGAFAEWCVKQANGGKVPWAGENFHYVPNITNWAQKNGVYEEYKSGNAAQSVKPGDMIIFGDGKRKANTHVGIVTSINPDGSIDTVEGNTSDACKKRHYPAGDPRIQGFLLVNKLEAMGLM
jgi:hypothetical protein